MYHFRDLDLRGSVLSLDPGSTNMGIAVAGYEDGRPVLAANAVMHNPIKGLTKDLLNKKHLFLHEVQQWVEKYDVQTIIIERFQSRGLLGNTVEEVSIMIGILLQHFDHLDVRLVIASTWKTQWNRNFKGYNLKDLYKICPATPHQVDAVLIGLYHLEKAYGYVPSYDPEHLVKVIGRASLTKTINRTRKTLKELKNA